MTEFIQRAGECCGFSAWIENEMVQWTDNVCGHGVVASGQFPLAQFEKVRDFDPASLEWDEWGTACISVNSDIEIVIDQYEISIPGCEAIFLMRRKIEGGESE